MKTEQELTKLIELRSDYLKEDLEILGKQLDRNDYPDALLQINEIHNRLLSIIEMKDILN